jgi:hypothetical protein
MVSTEIAEFIWIVNFFESIMYFLINIYQWYLGLFFDFPIFDYKEWISTFSVFFYAFLQWFLYYLWIFFTSLQFLFYIPENWIFVNFLWWRIEYYHLFFLSFIFLFILKILTFLIWKYFWRKREKVKNSKVNFYIIFFQFFPIIWFVWNFIAWKNYEISLWKMLLKNLLFLVVLFFWFVLYAVWANLISNWFFMPIYHFFYLIISPILIWLWAYFYYFKIKE